MADQDYSGLVTQNYQQFLGRAPEEAGLNYWTNQLSTGALTADQMANAIKSSQEGLAFASRPTVQAAPLSQPTVTQTTPQGLELNDAFPVTRDATNTTSVPWITTTQTPQGLQLNDAFPVTRDATNTTAAPLSQPNATSVIQDAFQQYLGRTPDQAGLNYWTNQVNSGAMTLDQAKNAIQNSQEATARNAITQDFTNYLGRTPDQAGLDFWTNKITSGEMTPEQAATAIQSSQEGVTYNAPQTVKDAFSTYLGRTPDQAGLDYWTNQIQSGAMTPEQVTQAIYQSQEAAPTRTLYDTYQQYLGRDPEAEGLKYWQDKIDSGEMSWDDVTKQIAGSAEANQYALAHPVQYFGDIYARDEFGNLMHPETRDEYGNISGSDETAYQRGTYGLDQNMRQGESWDQYQGRLLQQKVDTVDKIYSGLLGRNLTQDEKNNYINGAQYSEDPWNFDQIQKNVVNSAEFKQHQAQSGAGTWLTLTANQDVTKHSNWGDYTVSEPVTKPVYIPATVTDIPDAIRQISRSDNPQALVDQISKDPNAWMKDQLINNARSVGWLSKKGNDLYTHASNSGYDDINAYQTAVAENINGMAQQLLANGAMTQDEIKNLWDTNFKEAADTAQRSLDQVHEDSGFLGLGKVGEQVGDFLEKYQLPIMASILGGAVLGPAIGGAVGAVPGSATAVATNAAVTGLTQTAVSLASGAPTNKALIAGGLAAAGVGLGGALGSGGLDVAGSLVKEGMNPILANVAVGALSGGALGALSGAASGNIGAGALGGALAGGTSSGVNSVSNVFGGMAGGLARLAAGTAVGMLTGKDISSALQGAAVGTVVGLASGATKSAIDAVKSGKTDISVDGKITPNAETVDAMRKAAEDELNSMTGNADPDSIKKYVLSLPEEYFTKAISAVDAEVANSIKLAASYPTEAIGELYKQNLGREADTEGLNYWADQLRSGKMTLAQIDEALKTSSEGVIGSEVSDKSNIEKMASTLGDLIGSDQTKNLLDQGVQVAEGAVAAPWGIKTAIDVGAGPLIKQFPQLAGAVDTVGTVAAAILSRDPVSLLLHSSELNAGENTYDPRTGTATIDEPLVTAKEIDSASTAMKDYLAQQRALYPQQITQEMQLVQRQLAILDEFKAEYPQLYNQLDITPKVIAPTINVPSVPDVINPATPGETDQAGKVINTATPGVNTSPDVLNPAQPGVSSPDVVNPSTDRPAVIPSDVVNPTQGLNDAIGTQTGAGAVADEISRIAEQAGVRSGAETISEELIKAWEQSKVDAATKANVKVSDLTDALVKELTNISIKDLTKTDVTKIVDKVIEDVVTPTEPVTPVTPTEPVTPVTPTEPVTPKPPVVTPKTPTTPSTPTTPTTPTATPITYRTGTAPTYSLPPALVANIVHGRGDFDLGGNFGPISTFATGGSSTTDAAYPSIDRPQGSSSRPSLKSKMVQGDPSGLNIGVKFVDLPLYATNVMPTQFGFAEGGHVPEFYSEGGLSNRYVTGNGDGTSDDVPAMLANGEFVIPADVVSSLGNGSNDSGAQILDEFLQVIRAHKQKHDPKQLPPDSLGPLAYLNKATKKAGK